MPRSTQPACAATGISSSAEYEVFGFGATELQEREDARTLLWQFFADLFRRFEVVPLGNPVSRGELAFRCGVIAEAGTCAVPKPYAEA